MVQHQPIRSLFCNIRHAVNERTVGGPWVCHLNLRVIHRVAVTTACLHCTVTWVSNYKTIPAKHTPTIHILIQILFPVSQAILHKTCRYSACTKLWKHGTFFKLPATYVCQYFDHVFKTDKSKSCWLGIKTFLSFSPLRPHLPIFWGSARVPLWALLLPVPAAYWSTFSQRLASMMTVSWGKKESHERHCFQSAACALINLSEDG